MKLTMEEKSAVRDGQAVRVRDKDLEYVVIRADVFESVKGLVPGERVWTDSDAGDRLAAARERSDGNGSDRETSSPWTPEENCRRCDLIDMDIEGSITASDKAELERLQNRFHVYLDTVAPPPIEGARRLHSQLLQQKRRERGELPRTY